MLAKKLKPLDNKRLQNPSESGSKAYSAPPKIRASRQEFTFAIKQHVFHLPRACNDAVIFSPKSS